MPINFDVKVSGKLSGTKGKVTGWVIRIVLWLVSIAVTVGVAKREHKTTGALKPTREHGA